MSDSVGHFLEQRSIAEAAPEPGFGKPRRGNFDRGKRSERVFVYIQTPRPKKARLPKHASNAAGMLTIAWSELGRSFEDLEHRQIRAECSRREEWSGLATAGKRHSAHRS